MKASWPHASGAQTELTPTRSASRMKSASSREETWPATPICISGTPSEWELTGAVGAGPAAIVPLLEAAGAA